MRRQTSPPSRQHPRGFTLLELLIAISIMLILLAITATAIRVNNEADRIRGGARSLQSYMLGAKDRAIYAKAARGVRLLRDPNNPRLVSSMIYVEPTPSETYSVTVRTVNTAVAWSNSNPMRRVRLNVNNFNGRSVGDWQILVQRGLLTGGLRVRIPANDRGTWYVIQSVNIVNANQQDLLLTTEIRNPNTSGQLLETAEIELPPSVVQNSEPVQLPKGTVIDLDRCAPAANNTNATTQLASLGIRLPGAWRTGGSESINGVAYPFSYNNRMDVMFSPRGGVTGLAAGAGVIHLYVTDLAGAEMRLDAGYGVNLTTTPDPPIPDKYLVSIFSRTGNIIVSPVRTIDANNNGIADDPFYFAERGEVAGK